MKIAILNLIAVAASATVVPRGTVRTNDKNLRFRDLKQRGNNKGVHHGPRPETEGVTGVTAASKTRTKREKNHHKGPRPSPSTTVAPPAEDETTVAGGVAGGEPVPDETPPVEEEEPKKEKRQHGRAKKHEDEIEEEMGAETETDEEEQPVAKGAKVKDTRKKGGEAPPAPTPAEDVPVVDEPLPPEPTPAPTMDELTDAPTMVKLDDSVVVTDVPTFSPSQEPTWLDVPETRDIRLPLCPPPYMTDESVEYVGGDVVEVTSHIFQCHSLYEYYCNISDWDDSLLEENPDAEQMWNDAWTHIGPCTGEVSIEDINMVSSVAEQLASSNAPTYSVTTSAPTTQSTGEDTQQEEWQTHHLSDSSILYYKVNESEGTLSAEVVYDGESWLSIGFSEDGGMVGSEAVIGTPDDGIVQKYNLSGKSSSSVQPMPSDQQTLIDASIDMDEYGQTILRFTKLLIEDGEIGIGNDMKFLFACGSSTSLGYHSDRISFDIQL